MPSKPNSDRALVSIIIATFDYRIEADFVASWTRRQDCPPERYEVIVVTHGRDPEMDRQIRDVLRPQDQLIFGDDPSENRMFRFNKGRRAAKTDRFFFTEDHVIADRDCVSRLIEAISTDNEESVVVKSRDFAKHPLGTAEGVMCHRFFESGYSDAPWKRVQVRGFMISQKWFDKLGGFPTGYGEFGATALGIRMSQEGCQSHVAEKVWVTHVNHHSLSGLCEDALSYFQGEGNYRLEHSLEHTDTYLGPDQNWRDRSANTKANAAREMRSMIGLIRGYWRLLAGKPKFWGPISSQLADAMLRSYLGGTWRAYQNWFHLRCRKMAWRIGYRGNRRDELFHQLWLSLSNYGRQLAMLSSVNCPVTNDRNELESLIRRQAADEIEERRLIGFHTVECRQGRTFRWTQPVASMLITTPSSSHSIAIKFEPIRGPIEKMPLHVSVDGLAVSSSSIRIQGDTMVIDRDVDVSIAGTRQTVVTLATFPMVSELDPRRLGMAIRSVEVLSTTNEHTSARTQPSMSGIVTSSSSIGAAA